MGFARTARMRGLVLGSSASVVSVLPVFLTGALAVQLANELSFGRRELGLSVAAYWAASSLAAPVLGKFADRRGAIDSVRWTGLVSASVCLGIATTATSWMGLAGWLAAGGTAVAIGQPAANRLLIYTVSPEHQGWAFGVKQAAYPVASMLAALSIPSIALTAGWRWSFVLGAALSVVLVAAAGRRPSEPPSRSPDEHHAGRSPLGRVTVLVLGVGLGLSIVAMLPIPTFFVDAAVESGIEEATAAMWLAGGTLSAAAVQVITGLFASRVRLSHLSICGLLLMMSCAGFLLLAAGDPRAMGLGAIIALAGSWGFNAVFWYGVLLAYPVSPGSVTGAVMPGGLIGSIISPVAFGAVVERLGFSVGWVYACGAAAAAGGMMFLGSRLLPRINSDRRSNVRTPFSQPSSHRASAE